MAEAQEEHSLRAWPQRGRIVDEKPKKAKPTRVVTGEEDRMEESEDRQPLLDASTDGQGGGTLPGPNFFLHWQAVQRLADYDDDEVA